MKYIRDQEEEEEEIKVEEAPREGAEKQLIKHNINEYFPFSISHSYFYPHDKGKTEKLRHELCRPKIQLSTTRRGVEI